MNEFLSNFAKKIGFNLKKSGEDPLDHDAIEEAVPHVPDLSEIMASEDTADRETNFHDSAQSLSKFLVGSPGIFGDFYFPSDFIGGSCPRVIGEEEEIVWNAAAEACDTERVHVVWQSSETTIWYIAVRSSELASHPGSWCPFASLLPGMKDAITPPAVYTYFGEETATMMAITPDGLNIFRGSALVIRAKADRTSRDLENAPIVELVPDKIMQLQPVPWYSVSLFEDRARRILATIAVLTATGLAGLSFVVWLLASMTLLASRHDLSQTLERTQNKTLELMQTVERLRKSPMRDQLASFADLNDGLLAVNGLLEVYEVSEGKTRWRAIVPNNVTADRINDLGGKNIEVTPLGMAIGNAAEIDYEKTPEGRR